MANRPSTTSEKTNFISLALAAALSALLVVGVYEIRARLSKGHSASPPPAPLSERQESAEAEGATSRTRLGESCDTLRNRYTLQCSMEKSLPIVGPNIAPAPTASISPEREAKEMAESSAWAHPAKNELTDMATRCELRFISPAITESRAPTVDDEHAKALSLSTKERTDLDQTLREMHQGFADSVRQAYAEGATDPTKGLSLSPEQMINEIQSRPNSGFEQAARKLALERAGLAAPPAAGADLAAGERIFRLSAGLGDDFERRLADRLGVDRAHQLLYSPFAGPWTNRSAQSGCPAPQ